MSRSQDQVVVGDQIAQLQLVGALQRIEHDGIEIGGIRRYGHRALQDVVEVQEVVAEARGEIGDRVARAEMKRAPEGALCDGCGG